MGLGGNGILAWMGAADELECFVVDAQLPTVDRNGGTNRRWLAVELEKIPKVAKMIFKPPNYCL